MGLLSRQIHDVKVAGAGYALALAAAILGLVWATIWLDRLLSIWLGAVWAPLGVAAVFLLPVLIGYLTSDRLKAEEKSASPTALLSSVDDQLSELTRTAEGLVEKAPLVALALAALAGLLAARFPSALSLLVQVVSRYRPGGAST